MNFSTPEDADLLAAAQKSPENPPEDREDTITLAWETEDEQREQPMTAAVEANATRLAAVQETLDSLQGSIEDHQQAVADQGEAVRELRSDLDRLNGLVDTGQAERQSQQQRIETLEERVNDLELVQDDIDAHERQLDQLKSTTATVRDRLDRQERHEARLRAAVFDEPQPCPACEGGQISQTGGVVNPHKLVCDQCDFAEQTSIQ